MATEEKIVCLTGVSRGLGRAMVEGFHGAGWTVAGGARTAGAIDELNARLGAGPGRFFAVDVAEDEEVASFAEAVLREVGTPHLLVNNAGVMNEPAPLWEVGAEEFGRVIDVNVKGVASVIRHFVPAMMARGSGVIVNFSSGWGRSTSPEVAPYCASKWAVEGLTSALAQELPPGLAAMALNPGVIDTGMLRSCWGEGASAYENEEAWAERAVPYLISLGAKDNGRALTVPG